MIQHMPGDPTMSNPHEKFGTAIPIRVSKGGTKARPGGKTGPVIISAPGFENDTRPPYSDAKLIAIIEQGQASPREIPEELLDKVEYERVACKEDHHVLEQQFAGIGVSGTYGSLDGRASRRSVSKQKTGATQS
jgi:hypothetical protein